jgi:hypothetical protein
MAPNSPAFSAAGLLVTFALAAGCGDASGTGEVSGTVSVDGQPPPQGSSITFFPMDGKSPTAGGPIEDGKYTVRVPVGMAKIEIRAPRPVRRPKEPKEGPGPQGNLVEESLPPKYNDETELRLDVHPGNNPKNFELHRN